jgi:hypothetical protein
MLKLSKNQEKPSFYEETIKELKELDAKEVASMDIFKSQVGVWKSIADSGLAMGEYEDLMYDVLKTYWGDKAEMSLDYETKQVKITHPDGRLLIL